MSPIPSVSTAFALSPAVPSAALDPDSAGQSATAMSQHLLGTGGLVFAVVAIVSVAGYFYHGRGTNNNTRTSNTWASLTRFFSSMRHRGSAATSKAGATDWPVDLEVGPEQHVSMVYAKFFHPTFWNLVECHPATASAPAIYVEDEAEMPVSEPKPFGMNSFLDMDDDIYRDRDDNPEGAHEKGNAEQDPRSREHVAPYDTSSGSNINFSSEVIGTTVRSGAFLRIPDEDEDDSSETSLTNSELDFTCSPYDGVLILPPRSSDDAFETCDSELDLTCSPYDGILTTLTTSSGGLSETLSEFDNFDSTCSPYDGIFMTPPRSSHSLSVASSNRLDFYTPYDGTTTAPLRLSPRKRRYGMADMADLAQTLKDTIPEEGYPLVPTVSRRTGLCDVSEFVETHSTMACTLPDRYNPVDNEQMISSRDISVHDSHNTLRKSSNDVDAFVAPHEGLNLMHRLLEELRDANMDCAPRALSEDSDSECGDSEYNEDDEENRSAPRLTPAWGINGMRRSSLESTPTTPSSDSDVSDEGPVYPLTPPPRPAASDVQKACIASEATFGFDEVLKVVSPTSSHSPLSLPSKAYVRTHRDSRPFLYGPWSPLMVLPRH